MHFSSIILHINKFSVNLSIPPNTQCPSCHQPWLYFLLLNFESSISTSIPRPQICTRLSMKYLAQTCRTKSYQSTAVGMDICWKKNEHAVYWSHYFGTLLYLQFPLHINRGCSSGPQVQQSQDFFQGECAKNVPVQSEVTFGNLFGDIGNTQPQGRMCVSLLGIGSYKYTHVLLVEALSADTTSGP